MDVYVLATPDRVIGVYPTESEARAARAVHDGSISRHYCPSSNTIGKLPPVHCATVEWLREKLADLPDDAPVYLGHRYDWPLSEVELFEDRTFEQPSRGSDHVILS